MNTLIDNPWVALALWLLSYFADYYLTLYSARLYRDGAKEHFAFEGSLELTPHYQADIDALRRVSPRFILALVFSVLVIELMWYLSTVVVGLPALFELLVGGLVLREAAVLLRHARNLALFRAACAGSGSAGVQGQVRYARWLSLRLSAVDLFSFAVFLALLAPLTASWFVAGGAFACAVTAFQHGRRARQASAPA